MAEYSYRAIDQSGKEVSGVLVATGESDLQKKLTGQGYILTDFRAIKGYQRSRKIGGKVKSRDLITFTYHFSSLLSAGVSLTACLEDLKKGTSNEVLRRTLEQMTHEISSGASLGDTFEKFPNVFPPVYVQMMRAGEASGRLDVSLERVGGYMEWIQGVRDQVRKALVYPIILGLAVLGLVTLLLTFLIPRISQVFENAGVQLPLPTRMVLVASKFLIDYGVFIVAAIVALILLYVISSRTEGGRYTIDNWILRIPFFGPLIRKVGAARFCYTLSSLLQSGVSLLQALEIVKRVVGNSVMVKAIGDASTQVEEGLTLTESLEATEVFQPLVISMMSAGERTGHLDETLLKVNRFYDREIPTSVDRFMSILEPALIVFAGATVGLIVASALLPMFQMIQAVR